MSKSNLPSCVFVSKGQVDESLAQEPFQGKHLLEPFRAFSLENNLPFNVLEDHQWEPGVPEVHRHEDDVWLCLEGEVTFVFGGRLVEPWAKAGDDRELKGKSIVDGEERVMKQGDWLYIPAGQPHSHRTKGTARLVIIKLLVKNEVPLGAVPGWPS